MWIQALVIFTPIRVALLETGNSGTVDSISESVYAWRAMASHCRQIHDSCEVIPDTTGLQAGLPRIQHWCLCDRPA
jgi:hypothetical protein